MKSFQYLVLVGIAALNGSSLAASPTVYRCGDSYSQTPCANGTVVHADDARDDSQRAAAQSALSRDKALAKDIETSRRKDEAQMLAQDKAALARARAAHEKPEPEPKQVVVAPKKKPTDKGSGKRVAKVKEPEAGVFTATMPNEKPKKKSRKAKTDKP